MKKQKLIKVTASMDLPVGLVGTAVPAGYNGEMAIIFEGKDLGLYGFNGSSWSLIHRYQSGDNHYLYSGGMERYYVMSFTGQNEQAKLSFFTSNQISNSIPRNSSIVENSKLHDINEIPPYTAGDENKMLTVLSNGSLAWLLSNQNYVVDANGNYGETIEAPVSPWDSYGFIEERNDLTWGPNSSLESGVANIGYTTGANGSVLKVNGLGAAGPFRSTLASYEFTVSMWTKFTNMNGQTAWPNAVSLLSDSYRGDGSKGLIFFYMLSNPSRFEIFPGNGTKAVNYSGLNDGRWHHVVFSYNSTTVKVYVDGNLQGTIINAPNYSFRNDTLLQFGNNNYGSTADLGSNPIGGKMDRIQIIDYVLTDSEVSQLYTEGSAAISTYTELEAAGNSILLTASPLSTNGHAKLTAGVLTLDGNGDYLNYGTNYNFANNLTFGAWFKRTATGTVRLMSTHCRDNGNNGYFIQIMNSTNLQIRCPDETTGWQSVSFPYSSSDDQWHHVMVSWQKGVSSKIYLDGVLKHTRTPANAANYTANSQLFVGANKWLGNNPYEYFQGNIAGVVALNQTLTEAEILTIKSSTMPSEV